jgi:hypothetical protein
MPPVEMMPGPERVPPSEPLSGRHKPRLGCVLQALSAADQHCSNRSSVSARSAVPSRFEGLQVVDAFVFE